MLDHRLQPIVDLALARPVAYEILCGAQCCPALGSGAWTAWYEGLCDVLDAEGAGVPVFLNLDSTHAGDLRIVRAVESLTARHDCVLEWTERIDPENCGAYAVATEKFRSWRARGSQIAVDDIGADCGYDGIGRVLRVLPQYAKIDMGVMARSRGSGGVGLLRHMAAMLSALGCCVIAEGVETHEDMERCRAAGIPLAQGLLFGLSRHKEGKGSRHAAID
jgi:EAL domain-containing protein (putative c-di-GMP-specific phosphodiesterase class I)